MSYTLSNFNAGRNIYLYCFNQPPVILSFQLTTEKTCVEFNASRFYPVSNMTDHQICYAYEYYEPGKPTTIQSAGDLYSLPSNYLYFLIVLARYNNSMYEVISLYTNTICSVCGSYQCPYCPDYNGASCNELSSLLIISVVIFLIHRHSRSNYG